MPQHSQPCNSGHDKSFEPVDMTAANSSKKQVKVRAVNAKPINPKGAK